MASVADPVGLGFAKSLAQSGANVTGQSSQSRELLPKMLELLRTAVPKAQRVAVLVQTRNFVHDTLWNDVAAAAAPLGITLVRIDVDGAPDLGAALQKLAGSRVQAVLALPDDPPMMNLRPRVVAAANALRLPSYSAFVMPRLRPVHDENGAIRDIEVTYPCDLEAQMLEYSALSQS